MKIKRVAAWLLPVFGLTILAYIFGYSNFFEVKNIKVDSLAQYPEIEKVLKKPELNLYLGAKLARVNTRGAEKALRQVSWVANANVSRNWFSKSLLIYIEGRIPVAKVSSASLNGPTYIDKSGVIYRDPNFQGTLPTISISGSKYLSRAAKFVAILPPDLIMKMNSLTLTPVGDLNMEISRDGSPLLIKWGDGSKFEAKFKIFQRLLALPENAKLSEIDLTRPNFPLVKN